MTAPPVPPPTTTTTASSSLPAATTATNSSAVQKLRIAVGSKNPSKIAAVQQAFARAVNNNKEQQLVLDIQGFSVASGVPDQPFGDVETCLGGKNRAVAAFKAYKAATGEYPHFSIGMEGGLEWSNAATSAAASATSPDKDDKEDQSILLCCGWMCVYGRRQAFTVDALASPDTVRYFGDKKCVFGVAKTAAFCIPKPVSDLIETGLELGDADDKVFGRTNGKHGSGTVGILSKGLIDRSAYYEHALILALMPWIRPDVYPNGMS